MIVGSSITSRKIPTVTPAMARNSAGSSIAYRSVPDLVDGTAASPKEAEREATCVPAYDLEPSPIDAELSEASQDPSMDPVIRQLTRIRRLEWTANHAPAELSDEACTELWEAVFREEDRLALLRATSIEGATKAMMFLRADIVEHGGDDPRGQRLRLGLIDAALAALVRQA